LDLPLYFRVIRRFRFLVAGGLVLAIMLAVLAYARVSFDGGMPKLTPRKAEVWQSMTTLYLTQKGFPDGRTILPVTGGTSGQPGLPEFGDPTRFASLTLLYAQFASSDAVRRMALGNRHINALLTADAQFPPNSSSGNPLPVLQFLGQAPTPRDAQLVGALGVRALQKYIELRQDKAGIPQSQRVSVQVLTRPKAPTVLIPRKKTLSIAVFMATMIVVIGLAFLLENLRPRVKLVAVAAPERSPAERRSA
jgi:hypothetical protein